MDKLQNILIQNVSINTRANTHKFETLPLGNDNWDQEAELNRMWWFWESEKPVQINKQREEENISKTIDTVGYIEKEEESRGQSDIPFFNKNWAWVGEWGQLFIQQYKGKMRQRGENYKTSPRRRPIFCANLIRRKI